MLPAGEDGGGLGPCSPWRPGLCSPGHPTAPRALPPPAGGRALPLSAHQEEGVCHPGRCHLGAKGSPSAHSVCSFAPPPMSSPQRPGHSWAWAGARARRTGHHIGHRDPGLDFLLVPLRTSPAQPRSAPRRRLVQSGHCVLRAPCSGPCREQDGEAAAACVHGRSGVPGRPQGMQVRLGPQPPPCKPMAASPASSRVNFGSRPWGQNSPEAAESELPPRSASFSKGRRVF